MKSLTLALALQLLVPTPHLAISLSPSHTILIDHLPIEASGACLVFKSEDELVDGKPWAPRHCVWFEAPTDHYQEDWAFITTGHNYEMWVEVYSEPDIMVESNHIHEAH